MAMTEVQAPQKIVDHVMECWGWDLSRTHAGHWGVEPTGENIMNQIYDFLYKYYPGPDGWSVGFNEDTNKLNITAEFKDAEKATWWLLTCQ